MDDLSGHEGEIPIPMTSTYVSRPAVASSNGGTEGAESKRMMVVAASVGSSKQAKYRECLKNHAASMGGNATDGCGEFMPGGEEGTLESFKCSACGCHRNFHRKEAEGDHLIMRHGGGYVGRGGAVGPAALIMPLGAAAMHPASEQSTGDEMEGGTRGWRKRFRTKFTQEQKEKMLAFAERVSWRLQRQEEGLVQHFCQEIGVRRRVLKVWMHNNKHSFAKKNAASVAAAAAAADSTFPPLGL